MKLTSLTGIAFETNAIIDQHPHLELTFAQIHEAAENRLLVERLAERFGNKADFSLLLRDPQELAEVNHALAEVSGGMSGMEHKLGAQNSGLCLVVGLVLEAIQRHFKPQPQPRPEPSLEPF
jgi:hypothetical protein